MKKKGSPPYPLKDFMLLERDLPVERAVKEIVSLICPDRSRLQDEVLLLGVEV